MTEASGTLMDRVDIDKIDEEIEESFNANVTLAIQTDLLKKLIGKVERSVAKKTVQDIFRFIYLEIQDDKLILRGMNTDFTTEATAEQSSDGSNFKITAGSPGSICLPAE